MEFSKKTVSQEVLLAEWQEIQAAQKDAAAFRPLYERYFDSIFRYIHRRTADEALSAEICSQTFLKALTQLPRYEYRGVPFAPWLYRIASNQIAQHFRQSKKLRVVSIEEGRLGEMAEEMGTSESRDLFPEMITALDELKPHELELIELRFFEKRPFKEIADILNLTETNAKVKTYRILERLKKRILRKNKPQ